MHTAGMKGIEKMNQKGLNDLFIFVNFLHQKLLLVTAEQLQEDQL